MLPPLNTHDSQQAEPGRKLRIFRAIVIFLSILRKLSADSLLTSLYPEGGMLGFEQCSRSRAQACNLRPPSAATELRAYVAAR